MLDQQTASNVSAPTFDLEAFLTLYPWDADHLDGVEPLQWLWPYELAASPEALWPYVIDTSRLNRTVGYEEGFFEERDGILHGFYLVNEKRIEWSEPPWNWSYARFIGNIRLFSNGLISALRTMIHLEPIASGTRAWIYLGAVPRSPKFIPAVEGYFAPKQAGYAAALSQIATAAKQQAQPNTTYQAVPLDLSTTAEQRLQQLREVLIKRTQAPELVDRLLDYLQQADEFDLYRIQLVPLAQAWHVPLTTLLTLCLHAVREGLLTLSWDLICPHCRGVRNEHAVLSQIPTSGRCDICQIDFDASHETALEITFHVHPAIKDIPRHFYCLGDAGKKPHIKLQARLAPGQERTFETRLPVGTYRLRVIGETALLLLHIKSDAAEQSFTWSADEGQTPILAQPHPHIRLVNPAPDERVFIIEDISWQNSALRPAHVFRLQEFRDLFSYETLSSHMYLNVGIQTFVFCDVVGSTSLYATQGDAQAFFEIKQYYEMMIQAAQQHNGALVKTIGDGVMLVFATSDDGFRATLELQRLFSRQTSQIYVRTAIHSGTCLAVTFANNIDYFGQTINLAAKLQQLAQKNQIVMSNDVFAAVLPIIAAEGLSVQPVQLNLPSLPQPVSAHVVTVS